MARAFAHVLAIGGTGMLRAAARDLAERADVLTSVARTRRSLDGLDRELSGAGCLHRMLALDWSEPDRFLSGIATGALGTASPTGPLRSRPGAAAESWKGPAPDLVVAWLHDDALGLRLGRLLATRGVSAGAQCRFFQVLGSTTGDPAAAAAGIPAALSGHPALAVRQVVLGAHPDGRWLTHAEICRGTLDAIRADRPRFRVGTVPPGGGPSRSSGN